MPEYSCFLHPSQKGRSLDDLCPLCSNAYDFPLQRFPASINGKRIVKALSRGFYGAVYLAEHSNLGWQSAIKVIPVLSYAPAAEGGYGKDFLKEASIHRQLSEIDLIAAIINAGETKLAFGDQEIPCYWMELEYVEGESLQQIINDSPKDPWEIAQIACDLFDLVRELQQRKCCHNDLHAENIKIVKLDAQRARRDAIRPHLRTKILDLGSVADRSRSAGDNYSDIHRVAIHILDLVSSYEKQSHPLTPDSLRICVRLRQVAQLCCGTDKTRCPTPKDLKQEVLNACQFQRWWEQHVRLDSIAADYNAASMRSFYARSLFYDPGNWRKALLESGTQILIGMRGCGKTMLLRSIHWEARAYRGDDEEPIAVEQRLRSDQYIGLFVSCATLLRGPRPTAPGQVLRRLYLAYALEVARFVQSCQLLRIGQIHYPALEAFDTLIRTAVSWYQSPDDARDPFAIERALLIASNYELPEGQKDDVNPRDLFEGFTSRLCELADLLTGKRVLFLLDDVSVRYLATDTVAHLLNQLCFQSSDFSFKVSTETQTLHLSTPGGKPAQLGRDYELFDLGAEVFACLRSHPGGADFIEEVLMRRAQVTGNISRRRPRLILGSQSLMSVAREIRKGTKSAYWGIDVLSALCVGDIGDVLNLYERLVQECTGNESLSPEKQHQVIIDFVEHRLRALAIDDDWLYSHAVAFAEASHRELKSSRATRLRQYAEVFVKIDPERAEELFPRIIRLIDAGIFVVTGATPRMKTRSASPFIQFKLAYRRLLGLTNRIPLSMRDRFELSGDRLASWLLEPSSNKLGGPLEDDTELGDIDQDDKDDSIETFLFPAQENSSDNALPKEMPILSSTKISLPSPRTLLSVHASPLTDLAELEIDWGRQCAIAAIGFEDRSVGAWQNMISNCKPGRIILLEYEGSGELNGANKELLFQHLDAAGMSVQLRTISVVPTIKDIVSLFEIADGKDLLIDITSLAKPLIFTLVSESLRTRNSVTVLHTSAAEYHPPPSNLRKVAALLEKKSFRNAFALLDSIVSGERGPYECITVGGQFIDPSSPRFLAILTSLKHDPVHSVLEHGPFQDVEAIYPVHTSPGEQDRTIVARHLADYFAELHRGASWGIGSLDCAKAFEKLKALYVEYALVKGYNFAMSLTGTKMHTVGAGMLAATLMPAIVFYSKPSSFDPSKFTRGTGSTRGVVLKRYEEADSA